MTELRQPNINILFKGILSRIYAWYQDLHNTLITESLHVLSLKVNQNFEISMLERIWNQLMLLDIPYLHVSLQAERINVIDIQ